METSGVSAAAVVRVRLFGALEVSRREPDGSWHVVKKEEWSQGTPPRSVLKRLLTTPGRYLSRVDIEDDLWPEAGMELADRNLSNALMVIRRILGKDLIETTSSLCGIADQSQVWTDLDACYALLREAENQGGTTLEALPFLQEMRQYFERGTCLADESETWCHAVRADAERLCKQCRAWLAEGYEHAGKLWQAGEVYRAMARTIPPDEDALQRWMLMLARHGKHQDALQCYQETKVLWEAEGFMVSPEQHILGPEHTIQQVQEHLMQFDPTRRDALKSMATAFSLLAGAPALLRSESFSLLPLVHTIGEETLSRFDTLTTLCWKLLKGNELPAVEHLLTTFLPEIEMLAQRPSIHQKAMASFAAQAHIIKSLVVGHQDNLQAKLAECHYAIDYSRMASNSNFEVVALIQQAVTYDYRKQYAKSFKVYEQASLNLESVSPLLQARVLAGLAGAYARNGQQEYEAQRYLERAREVMPSHPESDPSFLYADCGNFTIPLWQGRVYFDLDQYDQAFSVFAQVEKQAEVPERIRTEFLNHQLEASIACGDLERSLFCFQQAGKAAIGLKSDRRQREVQEAGQMMLALWRQERKQIRATMTEVFAR